MALEPNSTFGNYRIGAVIGEGGMGQVYLATDTTLDRKVAIKVLPDSFAQDSDRVARFEREAKTLASLNHNNIAQIYGIEKAVRALGSDPDAAPVTAIVMELVEGPTLAERLEQGPLPPEEALRIARQIIDGLEAAHDKGIVHRDLKPANIKVTADGLVKILDFGIAKSIDSSSSNSGRHTPTMITPAVTESGVIMGTAAYMSPEQARGKFVDERTDIWAFGCLLYEMLTGQPAFGGEDVTVTLARILERDTDLSTMPDALSPAVRHTIKLCLQKDVKKRIADIRDVKLAMDGRFESPLSLSTTAAAALPLWRRMLPPAATALAAALLVWFVTLPAPLEPGPVERFDYNVPNGSGLVNTDWPVLDISADGRHFVYQAEQGFLLRTLDQIDARLISENTEVVATGLFMSPDGQSVAFFQGLPVSGGIALNRVAITGGAPVRLAFITFERVGTLLGASWAADDTIFVGSTVGIYRVAANGGELELIIPSQNGESLAFPRLLPDGDSLLFSVTATAGSDWDSAQIVVESLTTGERKVLVNGGSDARYLPTGHLVYAYEDTLFGIAFDAQTLSVSGARVPLVQGVSRSPGRPIAHYSVSGDGTLLYWSGTAAAVARGLAWADRAGNIESIDTPSRNYQYAALSPDGTRFVTDIRDQENDTWIWDLERATLQRLTFDPGLNRGTVWSPDGTRVAFSRQLDDGTEEIFWQSADGSGVAEPLTEGSPTGMVPAAFSADGAVLFYTQSNAPYDIWTVPVAGPPSAAAPLLAGPANESNPSLSPDGRWLAYQSTESGQVEVYVRPYPAVETGRWQVSTGGGTRPQWRGDGRELFYMRDGRPEQTLMAVPIQADATFRPGAPQVLFQHNFSQALRMPAGAKVYDVTPDGQRFLLLNNASASTAEAARFIIVQNWFTELERLVPTQ